MDSVRIPWSVFERDFGMACERDAEVGCRISAAMLGVCHSLATHMVTRFACDGALAGASKEATAAAPELLAPLQAALQLVRPHAEPAMPAFSQRRHLQLLEQLDISLSNVRGSRQPLRWRIKGVSAITAKAPRFEVNYKVRKDVDVGRDKAQLKQLTRQKKREHKSAIREIRRDADFVDQARYTTESAANERRRNERHKNFQDLGDQVGLANALVRRGGAVAKGGGSQAFKPTKRLKRGT
jgi:hypothetical protein